jgi:nucleoside-diphosphate-sugar epimerase
VSPKRGLAAVTGATGFLGQHVVRALADAGWTVRILARRDPASPFWSGLGPEGVRGDLFDAPALTRLCEGADLVVHVAGQIGGGKRDLDRVNIEGSRNLATAAAGTKAQVLQISSLAAREPQLSPYAASKRAGETAAREVLGERLTVIRPPAVYGPGDQETLRFFRLAASGPFLPVLDPAARVGLIHVEDAARQIVALAGLTLPDPVVLSDGRPEGYDWREIMQTAAEASERRPRLVRIPRTALYAMAFLDEFANNWRPRASVLTFGKVNELTHLDWGVRPNERAASAPPPEYDLLSGFRQTIGWYRSAGWL